MLEQPFPVELIKIIFVSSLDPGKISIIFNSPNGPWYPIFLQNQEMAMQIVNLKNVEKFCDDYYRQNQLQSLTFAIHLNNSKK